MDERQRGYLPHIDGLRALAVLSVIAYHLDARLLPGGFVGVDVFFVISGFVVSASMARFDRPKFFDYLGYFYARRVRRIGPALVACLLATGLASALFIPAAWLSDTSNVVGRWAFVGLSNFVLLRTDGDYFSPKVDFNPYTHTWSLGVEEQFYFVFPLLFFAWAWGRRGRALSTALFAVGALASLVLVWQVAQARPALAFYMLPTRFWELAAGVLLFQFVASRPSDQAMPAATGRPAVVGAAASLVVLLYGLSTARAGHSPFPDALLPVAGTLGLIYFLHTPGAAGPLRRLFENRVALAIGRTSYSLYLWHWPVFVLFRWTVGLESVAIRTVAVVLTFALAAASYRWIETPFRRAPMVRDARKWAVIAIGAVAILAAMGAYRMVGRAQPELSLSVVAQHADDWYPQGRDNRATAPDCAAAGHVETVPDAQLQIYSISQCRTPSAVGRVFVVGDSHAPAYIGMLKAVANRTGRDVLVYSRGGCSFASFQPWRDMSVPHCRQFGDSALVDIQRRARAGDVLFLPALRLTRFSDQWVSFDTAEVQEQMFGRSGVDGRMETENAIVGMLQPLAERGVSIVFEAPKPLFRSPPYRCADWFSRGNPICRGGLTMERRMIEDLRAPVLASFAKVAEQVRGTSVWDPLPVLCPGTVCAVQDNGRPLFFDGDHMSGYANRRLTAPFIAHLEALEPPAPVHAGAGQR